MPTQARSFKYAEGSAEEIGRLRTWVWLWGCTEAVSFGASMIPERHQHVGEGSVCIGDSLAAFRDPRDDISASAVRPLSSVSRERKRRHAFPPLRARRMEGICKSLGSHESVCLEIGER
jgi:hypothetical protein